MSEELEEKDAIKNKISEFLKTRDKDGNTLLHYVVQTDNSVFAEQLIKSGCDVNEKNHKGDPPLILAVQKNQLEMVRILMNAGANYNNDYFYLNNGPLNLATYYCCPEIVKLLIEWGLNVNARTELLLTPLHWAMSLHDDSEIDVRCEMIKTLIDAGADVHAEDCRYWKPIYISVRHGFHEGFELMLKMGADIYIKENLDFNFLNSAVRSGNCAILSRLIELGYDVNMKDDIGNSSLHIATAFGQSEVLEFLFNNGAKINANYNCLDPLSYGLLIWGGDYNHFRDMNEDHELNFENRYHKIYYDRMDCLEILIENGSDIDGYEEPVYIVLDKYKKLFSDFLGILLKNGAELDFNHPSVCKVINSSDGLDYAHLLLKHTAMFEAQNRIDGPENFDLNKLNDESRRYYARCRDELELMKSTKINDTNVSFFNILTDRDIGPFTRNEQIKIAIEDSDIKKRFPIYNDPLCERFSKEVEFQELLEQATNSLCCILKWDRSSNHMLLSNILRYLDEDDLNNLALVQ